MTDQIRPDAVPGLRILDGNRPVRVVDDESISALHPSVYTRAESHVAWSGFDAATADALAHVPDGTVTFHTDTQPWNLRAGHTQEHTYQVDDFGTGWWYVTGPTSDYAAVWIIDCRHVTASIHTAWNRHTDARAGHTALAATALVVTGDNEPGIWMPARELFTDNTSHADTAATFAGRAHAWDAPWWLEQIRVVAGAGDARLAVRDQDRVAETSIAVENTPGRHVDDLFALHAPDLAHTTGPAGDNTDGHGTDDDGAAFRARSYIFDGRAVEQRFRDGDLVAGVDADTGYHLDPGLDTDPDDETVSRYHQLRKLYPQTTVRWLFDTDNATCAGLDVVDETAEGVSAALSDNHGMWRTPTTRAYPIIAAARLEGQIDVPGHVAAAGERALRGAACVGVVDGTTLWWLPGATQDNTTMTLQQRWEQWPEHARRFTRWLLDRLDLTDDVEHDGYKGQFPDVQVRQTVTISAGRIATSALRAARWGVQVGPYPLTTATHSDPQTADRVRCGPVTVYAHSELLDASEEHWDVYDQLRRHGTSHPGETIARVRQILDD